MKTESYNIEMLDKFLRGEKLEETETAELEQWIESGQAQETLFDDYRHKWDEASWGMDSDCRNRMWVDICQRANGKTLAAPHRTSPATVALRWVAIVVLCLTTVFTTYRLTLSHYTSGDEYAVSVKPGQKAEITLPDGTQVWLNSNSELRYDNGYGHWERRVVLSGEAFFEVPKSNSRFVVETNDMNVAVYGTSFNVKAYEDEEVTTATLVSGSIEVQMDDGKTVMLKPHDELAYNSRNKNYMKTVVDNVEDVSLWRSNQLVFRGETLDAVARMLHRLYDVEVIFISEQSQQYTFSGTIKNNSLMNVLENISLSAPICYTVNGRTIVISDDATRMEYYNKNN